MQDSQNSYETSEANSYFAGTKQMQHEQITQKEEHEFQLKCKDKDQQYEKDLLNQNLPTPDHSSEVVEARHVA